MSEAAFAAAVPIVLVLLAGAGWVVKEMWAWIKSRLTTPATAPTPAVAATPEQINLSQATALVSEVSTDWAVRWVRLEATVAELSEDRDRLVAEVAELRTDRNHLRGRVDRLSGALVHLVAPVIEWVEAGAQPPPPAVPEELRALLAELLTSATSAPPTREPNP